MKPIIGRNRCDYEASNVGRCTEVYIDTHIDRNSDDSDADSIGRGRGATFVRNVGRYRGVYIATKYVRNSRLFR
jgi:hypothetical protein